MAIIIQGRVEGKRNRGRPQVDWPWQVLCIAAKIERTGEPVWQGMRQKHVTGADIADRWGDILISQTHRPNIYIDRSYTPTSHSSDPISSILSHYCSYTYSDPIHTTDHAYIWPPYHLPHITLIIHTTALTPNCLWPHTLLTQHTTDHIYHGSHILMTNHTTYLTYHISHIVSHTKYLKSHLPYNWTNQCFSIPKFAKDNHHSYRRGSRIDIFWN